MAVYEKAEDSWAPWFMEGVLRDGKRWIIPLEPLPFSVGRMADCNLVLASKSVSRNHADLFLKDSGLWVRDLESRNGTYLNRKKIKGAVPVRGGDILHFGTVEFRIGFKESSVPENESTATLLKVTDLSNLFQTFEADMKALIEQRAVIPLFQPIVHLGDKTRFGYEVTCRGAWEGMPRAPEELFGLAAGLGCEADLSRLFWSEGLRVGGGLPDAHELFINIHPAELAQPSLATSLGEALAALRRVTKSARLTVELSEKAVTNLAVMARFRAELLEMGVSLAYDDFGAGQTRLLELVEVPPQFLKFDHALIRDIHQRPRKLFQVVKALVHMAEDLGIACIAEGVECAAEAEACAHAGFPYAQGYYLGRPSQLGISPPPPSAPDIHLE
jgi:EAL domain-containing protein (putative c-di-GMP-specific phosphodiesterase class I)